MFVFFYCSTEDVINRMFDVPILLVSFRGEEGKGKLDIVKVAFFYGPLLFVREDLIPFGIQF